MDHNICHFIPYHKDYDSLHTIHFVMETKYSQRAVLKSESVYKIYYVSSGDGYLHTTGRIQPISEGDIFFTFPAETFCIQCGSELSCMYISFLGSRAHMIMDKIGISEGNGYFPGCGALEPIWRSSIHMKKGFLDLVSESVLLYSFAWLGQRSATQEESLPRNTTAFFMIKKYIDDNFTMAGISLERISHELSYNPKYISGVFKKNMGVGISEYLNKVRIQHACMMIKQGFTSVNDIAACCGYKDPQYFSKVFKKHLNISPNQYIHTVQGENK